MKVLFVSSGNKGNGINPIIVNQGDCLQAAGVELEYFAVKGKGIKGYLKNVAPLCKKIREYQPDVVHAHYSLTAFAASLACWRLKAKGEGREGSVPLVVSLMGSDVKASKRYKQVIRLFARLFRWKTIIVKSQDMFNSLGMPEAIVVPNGVNLERFRELDQKECRERLGWGEGTHILFPANPDRLEKDWPLAEAALHHTPYTVHFFRNVPNEETPYHYNAADLVLMTSKWEGSPNAIKEALACSRPIVTTNVGDVRERLSGVVGCYVAESREPEELAELIEKALKVKKTVGREKLIADGLDNKQIAQTLIEIYNH